MRSPCTLTQVRADEHFEWLAKSPECKGSFHPGADIIIFRSAKRNDSPSYSKAVPPPQLAILVCLTHHCLVPQALYSHPASNFVLLLAHSKLLAFKGLYACNSDDDGTADHVFGIGPPQVDASMVSCASKRESKLIWAISPNELYV